MADPPANDQAGGRYGAFFAELQQLLGNQAPPGPPAPAPPDVLPVIQPREAQRLYMMEDVSCLL